MQPTLYVSHDVADTQLAGNWVDLLEAALPDLHLVCTSLPGYAEAAAQAPFGGAEVVIGLLTPQALSGAAVPFELGAAWQQGLRVIPVLQGELSPASLTWSLDPALSVLCDTPDAHLALVDELGRSLSTARGEAEPIAEALQALCPGVPATYSDISSVRETGAVASDAGATQRRWPISEPPPAPEAGPSREAGPVGSRRGLPSCASSFAAGRALADCLFNAEPGAAMAQELDVPFGSFVATLGAPWDQLRRLDDGDLWTEVVDSLLAGLVGEELRVKAWYTLGYQLSNALNLVHVEVADEAALDELREAFARAQASLQDAASLVGLDAADITRIGAMLENLIGPEAERDYTLIARLQNLLREHAESKDADLAA